MFVIPGFCFILMLVNLGGLNNIVRYTEDSVIKRVVISMFHGTKLYWSALRAQIYWTASS